MAKSNQILEESHKQSPGKFNMEEVDESKPYIQLNLGIVLPNSCSSSEQSDSEEDQHSYSPPLQPIVLISQNQSESAIESNEEADQKAILIIEPEKDKHYHRRLQAMISFGHFGTTRCAALSF